MAINCFCEIDTVTTNFLCSNNIQMTQANYRLDSEIMRKIQYISQCHFAVLRILASHVVFCP